MADVQTKWVKEDGKWCQKPIEAGSALPSLPSRPAKSTNAPILPSRPTKTAPALPSRNGNLGASQTAPRPIARASPPTRPISDEESSPGSRRTSTALSRRTSDDSVDSAATASTSLSTLSNGNSRALKAPEYDASLVPKLPPRRTQEEKDAETRTLLKPPGKIVRASTTAPQAAEVARPPPHARPQTRGPPPLPNRGNLPVETAKTAEEAAPPPVVQLPDRPVLPIRPQASQTSQLPVRNAVAPSLPTRTEQTQPALPSRGIIPPPAKRSALSMGFNNSKGATQPQPATRPAQPGPRPVPNSNFDGTPPPVPMSSRPDLAALQASKPKPSATTAAAAPAAPASAAGGCCLECRDFSGPDDHAARFPRESLPSHDLGWLSQQLTGPFTSDTDKARAIFTWLHHNIAYDTEAFFNNNVQPSTPHSTIASGLAVCEGYAGLFAALALKSGLEAKVIGGHGKGFGYAPYMAGNPMPEYDAGHAWNSVKIDNGEWKLIDPCWGAGSVCDRRAEKYQKRFAPEHFTQSNDMFAMRHYPGDDADQYRNDGRIQSWEEYIMGDQKMMQVQVFSGYMSEEGISSYSIKPSTNPIVLAEQGPTVRFSFQTVCPHYNAKKRADGGYYLYVLNCEGISDKKKNNIPFQKADGVWWCDVPTKDLGHPGQAISIYTVTVWCGKPGRGLTADQYTRTMRGGCYSYSLGGVARFMVA